MWVHAQEYGYVCMFVHVYMEAWVHCHPLSFSDRVSLTWGNEPRYLPVSASPAAMPNAGAIITHHHTWLFLKMCVLRMELRSSCLQDMPFNS